MWFELNMTDEKLTENQCRDTFTLKPTPPWPTTTTELQLLFLRLADNTMSTASILLLYCSRCCCMVGEFELEKIKQTQENT